MAKSRSGLKQVKLKQFLLQRWANILFVQDINLQISANSCPKEIVKQTLECIFNKKGIFHNLCQNPSRSWPLIIPCCNPSYSCILILLMNKLCRTPLSDSGTSQHAACANPGCSWTIIQHFTNHKASLFGNAMANSTKKLKLLRLNATSRSLQQQKAVFFLVSSFQSELT